MLNFELSRRVSWSSPFCHPSVPLHDTIALIFHHQSGRLILSPHSLRTPSRPWRRVICHGSYWSVLEESRDCSAQIQTILVIFRIIRLAHVRVCPPQCQPWLEETPDAYRCCVWSGRTAALTWPLSVYQCCTSQTPSVKHWMWCRSAMCPPSESAEECPPKTFLNMVQNSKDLWKWNWFNCSGDLFDWGPVNWKEV